MIKTHFSGIQDTLIDRIKSADTKIAIAVSWFVNHNLFKALLKRADEGVQITLVIINDDINVRSGSLNFQQLIDKGVAFYYSSSKRLMHNKFCIIDSNILFTGSYNWTYAAERKNLENVVEIYDQDALFDYESLFNQILQSSTQVYDLAEYLKKNPPASNTYDRDALVIDEGLFLIQDDGLEIEDLYILTNELLTLDPNNTDLKEGNKELKKRYSEDLEALCLNYPSVFLNHVGEKYRWSFNTLTAFERKIFPGRIQCNENTIWTADIIDLFKETLFYWSSNLGSCFKRNRKIYMSLNEMKTVPYELQMQYSDLKRRYPEYDDSTLDPDIRFFINPAFDGFVKEASSNKSIVQLNYEDDTYFWSEAELLAALPLIDTSFSSASKSIVWSSVLIQRVRELKPHQFFYFCSCIYLDEQNLFELKGILDWKGVAKNRRIKWNRALFEEHKDLLLRFAEEFSGNSSFPWTLDFLDEYKEQLRFDVLSGNPSVPFTSNFIISNGEKWLYYTHITSKVDLSSNIHVPFDEQLLDALKHKWHWPTLAGNTSVPWTLRLINKFLPNNNVDEFIRQLGRNKRVWEKILEPAIDDIFLLKIASHIPSER